MIRRLFAIAGFKPRSSYFSLVKQLRDNINRQYQLIQELRSEHEEKEQNFNKGIRQYEARLVMAVTDLQISKDKHERQQVRREADIRELKTEVRVLGEEANKAQAVNHELTSQLPQMKVGDPVVITDLDFPANVAEIKWVSEMDKTKGKRTTITKHDVDGTFRVDIDNGGWSYHRIWLRRTYSQPMFVTPGLAEWRHEVERVCPPELFVFDVGDEVTVTSHMHRDVKGCSWLTDMNKYKGGNFIVYEVSTRRGQHKERLYILKDTELDECLGYYFHGSWLIPNRTCAELAEAIRR